MMGRIVPVAGCAAAAALLLLGCAEGEGPHGGDDGGAGQDASVWWPEITEPEPPASPAPPELPRMTPCPEGWREKVDPDDAALVTCDPWPEGGRQDCAEDEAHFPGRPRCERIGPPCPEGEWPAEIPEDARVLYVRAGEPAGGDGTRERPLGRIADAVAAADDGDVIALSKGVFDEEVWIDRAVLLLGACVLETRIAPSGAGPAAVTLRAAAVVRDLQIGGAEVGVEMSGAAVTAVLDSVVVREATGIGVYAYLQARLEATNLVVRETAGDTGYGLYASGALVSLERVVIDRARIRGLMISGGVLTATDLVVSDTKGNGAFGEGLVAVGGAQVALERAVLRGNRTAGVWAFGEGTLLTAVGLLVSNTREQESDGAAGYGIVDFGGARVTLERAALERNHAIGVGVVGEGTELTAADLVISDTQPQEANGMLGGGVEVNRGARVALERVIVKRNHDGGVVVTSEAVLTGTDLVVSDTDERPGDGFGGVGLEAREAAQVALERVVIERNHAIGVVAYDDGVTART
ncbi:MAG: hypothetical protein HYY06_33480 [Deltaproteobacteria bacterium]|nr:hypothetical protein [Deltaproteobacteria bacterium]